MTSFQQEGHKPRLRTNSLNNKQPSTMDERTPGFVEAHPQDYIDDDDDYDEPTLSRPSFIYPSTHHRSSSRPLIDYVKNEWRTNPKYGQVFGSPAEKPRSLRMLSSYLATPKVRRYIIVYLLLISALFFSFRGLVYPYWSEQGALTRSLNVKMKSGKGWFGTNARPEFADMIHLKTLDSSLIPNDQKHGKGAGKRLIIVGDVHGCKTELVRLLDKVSFNPKSDHLILAGDMIAKGPDSLGVIDLARDVGASCVRGNHEDRVLLVHRDLTSSLIPLKGPQEGIGHPEKDMMDEESFSRGNYDSRKLAKKLTDKQVEWLKGCPVILRVGEIAGLGEVVTVHAGLVPGVALEKQDPVGVMSMRTIDLETHVPSNNPKGTPWSKLWNKHQSMLSSNELHSTVIYGHDSHRGLSISKYTKGLDTGCVSGGKLTALVISDGGNTEIQHVKCKDRRPKKPLKSTVEDVLRAGKVGDDNHYDDDDE